MVLVIASSFGISEIEELCLQGSVFFPQSTRAVFLPPNTRVFRQSLCTLRSVLCVFPAHQSREPRASRHLQLRKRMGWGWGGEQGSGFALGRFPRGSRLWHSLLSVFAGVSPAAAPARPRQRAGTRRGLPPPPAVAAADGSLHVASPGKTERERTARDFWGED